MCESVQLFYSLGFKQNFIPDNKVSVVVVRQDNAFVCDFVILFARKRNPSATQFNSEGVLVDDFVVPLSQLAMNLHAKTDELKNLFLIKQFRHKSLKTRISLIHAKLRHELHKFTLMNSKRFHPC